MDKTETKESSLIVWGFLLSVLMFFILLLQVFALTDIYFDYVSEKVIKDIPVSSLPEWSAAKGEWMVLKVSVFLNFIFLIVIIKAFSKVTKNIS